MSKGKKNTQGKKEFAPNIGFWPAKSGNGFTVYIDEKVKETLDKAEEGGRLYLQEVSSDNENAPAFRVTFFAAEKGEAAQANDGI